jgi:two-component system sensor histidine kinase AlgZ
VTPNSTKREPRPTLTSPTGAADRSQTPTDDFFLPDFCEPRIVFAVVLLGELLAFTLALTRSSHAPFLNELARLSMFVQWIGLTSTALMCGSRKRLAGRSVGVVSAAVFALLLANTVVLSEAVYWIGRRFGEQGLYAEFFPAEHAPFVLRNAVICLIVTALVLRYLFVSHHWQAHVRAEARSRIDALQARMRPHFLFNSLNTIAALTRSDPKRAEEAVEDLADLFRATLRDSDTLLRLKEELELTRIYQRIEGLRLGQRLEVMWDVTELPMRALVPGLMIQPLLENAIYHGIEPLDAGGRVVVSGRVVDGRIEISVANPVATEPITTKRSGNRLAVENIRERLRLAYGAKGELAVDHQPTEYRVTIRFPYTE